MDALFLTHLIIGGFKEEAKFGCMWWANQLGEWSGFADIPTRTMEWTMKDSEMEDSEIEPRSCTEIVSK